MDQSMGRPHRQTRGQRYEADHHLGFLQPGRHIYGLACLAFVTARPVRLLLAMACDEQAPQVVKR